MIHPLPAVALNTESDLVLARQRSRDVAQALGLGTQDQIRVATTVSEIARNALRYAGGGRVEFEVMQEAASAMLVMRVIDRGPGIANLDDILAGRYRSGTGMGIGLSGAMRLMDHCDIKTRLGVGTTVTLHKQLPAHAATLDADRVARIALDLASVNTASSIDELARQNGELVATLAALRERQDELTQMARELEETNRGVVALYAELEDQAEQLRRADEMKSLFLSNVSHEFRTPLSSIRALSGLLLSGVDGALASEHAKQVGFIDKATHELSDLVNDLLDLAKIEAGKVNLVPTDIELADLFGGLRGTLKPLLTSERVALTFDMPAADGSKLVTDEAKLSQILRNLISNALKFTLNGEVRISCQWLGETPPRVRMSVCDTGIGLAPEHLEWIFEEFSQVEHALQRNQKGTGLGLPLCRRLAGLLGGKIWVESEPGRGSCFHVELPSVLPSDEGAGSAGASGAEVRAPQPVLR
jgi:signal transduction histidine kinase